MRLRRSLTVMLSTVGAVGAVVATFAGCAVAPTLPDVPPIAETAPGYAVTGWLGIGAPKGTPSEAIERLNKEINAALADREFAARLATIGSQPRPGSPADFGKFIAAETEKWGKVVKFAGLKAD